VGRCVELLRIEEGGAASSRPDPTDLGGVEPRHDVEDDPECVLVVRRQRGLDHDGRAAWVSARPVLGR